MHTDARLALRCAICTAAVAYIIQLQDSCFTNDTAFHACGRCQATALSIVLLSWARILGVPTRVHTTALRLSQARDRSCKRACRTVDLMYMHESCQLLMRACP
eukprot:1608806-Pleurochrysis_carterae.AAC.1